MSRKISGVELDVSQMACSSCGHICEDVTPGYPNGCVQCTGGSPSSFLCSWCNFELQQSTVVVKRLHDELGGGD